MTAEGPTGAPLRQQIAEAIHAPHCFFNEEPGHCQPGLNDYDAADAVVALLQRSAELLAVEFDAEADRYADSWYDALHYAASRMRTWLPSTPPDTSSSETT